MKVYCIKFFGYVSLFILVLSACSRQPKVREFKELNVALDQRNIFQTKKSQSITHLYEKLNLCRHNDTIKYKISEELYSEYFSYENDSSLFYASQMLDITKETGGDLYYNAIIKKGASLIRAGLFLEAREGLAGVNLSRLSTSRLVDFYYTMSTLYFELDWKYANTIYQDKYLQLGIKMLSRALRFSEDKTPRHYSLKGLYHLKKGEYHLAASSFHTLFNDYQVTGRQLAVDASTFASVQKNLGDVDSYLRLLEMAAIEDIKIVNRENFALLELGNYLYNRGQIAQAERYLDIAFKDARMYGAQLRQEQLSLIISDVIGAKARNISRQKDHILMFILVILLLLLVIMVILILLYRQLIEVRRTKTIVEKKNLLINRNNAKLKEANTIKDEYIGFSFRVSSELLTKLEYIYTKVDRSIIHHDFNELRRVLSSGGIKEEREHFLDSFDRTFLSLFPTFIVEFNSLFDEDKTIISSSSKNLNTEVRIFALIRLGITDNKKISQILDYSINTINSYKTKVKNRSKVNNDQFEQAVKEIGIM
ncbi:DUF6377 domain-containing protein [Halosquirtibacter xylanolyticus]|uniref:DUF6377 domain-containing protein n=1 Tax=Halosquirtibacter xylanolyticus TaxID=3374599 RepID=UPI00374A4616|nr:DUF6377 domain-containing protein [Prolixibacteraceae bacterium]